MSTLLLLLITAVTPTVEIPLSQMWGINIKGVSSPGKLVGTVPKWIEPHDELADYAVRKWAKEQPTHLISDTLGKRKEFGPGFIVASTDGPALLSAKLILCDGVKAKETFSTQHALTLILYTGSCNVFDLKPVKRTGNQIEVEYVIPDTPFKTLATTPHFAMVPLGKLPAGKYEVVIPEHKGVCSSFEFQVEAK